MDCGRARRLLWPDTGPREATGEIIAARKHASGCETCRGFPHDMQQLSQRISRAVSRPVAPPEIRDRLFKVLALARTSAAPARSARLRQMLVAGSAALLAIGFAWLGYLSVRHSSDRSDPISSMVEDRLRAQKGAGLASSDSLQVAQWLAERLPFAVQIPIFPDARLLGARLLLADRKSGAVVEYAVLGQVLTYYILPIEGVGMPRHIQLAAREGYRVASWHDAGLTHALVGTLSSRALIRYARFCMHQMAA